MCQQLATLVWKNQISNCIFPSGRQPYILLVLVVARLVVACCNLIDASVFIVGIFNFFCLYSDEKKTSDRWSKVKGPRQRVQRQVTERQSQCTGRLEQ